MDADLAEIYEDLTGRKLPQKPNSEEEVRDILSSIRTKNGYVDSDDEAEMQHFSPSWGRKYKSMAKSARRYLAKLTKTISSQLYHHYFRFFFELIQNADDSMYTKLEKLRAKPSITFTIRSNELWVDLNEDGFSLADVIAICSTGESSKINKEGTTGEKGFGFKAVFAIATDVHVQSGLWSFAFRHEQHEDGIGMVTPLWRPPNTLPEGIQTRFTLTYSRSNATNEFLDDLCDRFMSQPVTVVSFLRNIQKISIELDDDLGRHDKLTFEKLPIQKEGFHELLSTVNGETTTHRFRGFCSKVKDMPARDDRHGNESEICLYFPVKSFTRCAPRIDPDGQYVFACLPTRQFSQLPFIIQGDFILSGDRQGIVDNLWNRKLRDSIAGLFATAAAQFAEEADYASRFQWLKYLPVSPIEGFWKKLPQLIKYEMDRTQAFISHDGMLYNANELRSLSSDLIFDGKPLLPEPRHEYKFLSLKYDESDAQALATLGVRPVSLNETLELICDDSRAAQPRLMKYALDHEWHEKFAHLIQSLISQEVTETGINITPRLQGALIIPVLNGKSLEWWSLDRQKVYFPELVNERFGKNTIKINMPSDLGYAVVHPKAAQSDVRHMAYKSLGVQHCDPDAVCKAIEKAQGSGRSKKSTDLLAHFELLFWYSHSLSFGVELHARTSGGGYNSCHKLFFHSPYLYDAALVLDLKNNKKHQQHFLCRMYQDSQVARQVRGSMTWEEWLHVTAGVRWHLPLRDINTPSKLHPLIEIVRENNGEQFLPMLQAHWEKDYSLACISRDIKEAVLDSLVLCQHGARTKLRETWFPAPELVKEAKSFGVENDLPILRLPKSKGECVLSAWGSLSDLGVPSGLSLPFYILVLTTIADLPAEDLQVSRMVDLYTKLGEKATLLDREELQRRFESQALIWDFDLNEWLHSTQCVWHSPIPLQCTFVVNSAYSGRNIEGLFKTFLNLRDVSFDDLILELRYMHDDLSTLDDEQQASLRDIYGLLQQMAENDGEIRNSLLSYFKEKTLIYHEGSWHLPDKCLWHEMAKIGGHVPIKTTYPELEEFFVKVLGVKTITDRFMMKELAKAAAQPNETIRDLILSTALVLSSSSSSEELQESVDILSEAQFLPCRTADGDRKYLGVDDVFFILDDLWYTDAFKTHITVLDFTYQELTKLHRLLHMLELDQHYLTKHVAIDTEEGDVCLSDSLTKEFQECAYALSCCAVFHHSPRYFNGSTEMHTKLMNTQVFTSPNMATTLSVRQDRKTIRVPAEKAFLVIKEESDSLRIILPEDAAERRSCFRSQLPKGLAQQLKVLGSNGKIQIHRLLNETDLGTDEILEHEGIPQADEWLVKTERLAQAASSPNRESWLEDGSGRASSEEYDASSTASGHVYEHEILVSETHTAKYQRRRTHIPIPAQVNHLVDAPEYGRVLEHVRRQASGVIWRNRTQPRTLFSTDDHVNFLSNLTTSRKHSILSSHYPELFGSDDYMKKRVGAAGELFAFQLLKALTNQQITLNNWPSTIRHFVRAHHGFKDLSQCTETEIADIMYTDDGEHTLEARLHRGTVGDSFPEWLPEWMCGSCQQSDDGENETRQACEHCSARNSEPLEWLFEVKTTIGPCETSFFMGSPQYDLMKRAGTTEAPNRRQVYCIIRVYDLLKHPIGVRIYIDPWRFRDTKLNFNTTDKWRVKAI